jgi:hypothetical protein
MVISTIWSRRSLPQYVASHPGETLPHSARSQGLPYPIPLFPVFSPRKSPVNPARHPQGVK